jgi:hypothetical protein
MVLFGMAVRQFTFNLTSTPQELTGLISTDRKRRVSIVFNTDKVNNDTSMIGSSAVTDTNFGFHLDADETVVLEGWFTSTDRFYARAKTTSSILHVLVAGA